MPRSCSICAHPRTAAIAKDLAAGGSNRVVSNRYEVTASAVQRHRTGCLRSPRRPKADETSAASPSQAYRSEPPRFENGTDAISTPADLLTRLRSLFRLGDLLEEAYQKRDVDAVVKLAREYRQAAESYAKVAGWLTDGVSVNVDARKQSIALLGALSEDDLRAIVRADLPVESIATVDATAKPIAIETRA